MMQCCDDSTLKDQYRISTIFFVIVVLIFGHTSVQLHLVSLHTISPVRNHPYVMMFFMRKRKATLDPVSYDVQMATFRIAIVLAATILLAARHSTTSAQEEEASVECDGLNIIVKTPGGRGSLIVDGVEVTDMPAQMAAMSVRLLSSDLFISVT
jgi:hypothetical protein